MLRDGRQKHSWIWFPAFACPLEFTDAMQGMMRAEIHGIQMCTTQQKLLPYPLHITRELCPAIQAAPYACLIGDHNCQPPMAVCASYEFEDTRDKLCLLWSMDVTTIDIDHAVAVQK